MSVLLFNKYIEKIQRTDSSGVSMVKILPYDSPNKDLVNWVT